MVVFDIVSKCVNAIFWKMYGRKSMPLFIIYKKHGSVIITGVNIVQMHQQENKHVLVCTVFIPSRPKNDHKTPDVILDVMWNMKIYMRTQSSVSNLALVIMLFIWSFIFSKFLHLSFNLLFNFWSFYTLHQGYMMRNF